MRTVHILVITVSCLCLYHTTAQAMKQSQKKDIRSISAQKEQTRQQFTALLQQLPNTFDNAFAIIQAATADKQWINAEVRQLAIQLFDALCAKNTDDATINQQLTRLAPLTPKLPDTVQAITKNCRLFMKRRELAPLMPRINILMTTWQNATNLATEQLKNLTTIKSEYASAPTELKNAIAENDSEKAAAEYGKLKEWKTTLEEFQMSVNDIAEIRLNNLTQRAIELEQPEISALIQNTDKLNTNLQKELRSYQALEQQYKQLHSAALTKANTIKVATEKEITIETQRHAEAARKQATMQEDLASEMRYEEGQRHTTEQTRLINKWNIMNQWREIAGENTLDIPQELMN